ncbi:MAG: GntG family PLP-dependent aldolase [Pirellulales bacterium]|nr:GntG family PLP-dependent aldolase [Pirellulales bacterium]
MTRPLDFRSDTVTRPTPGMLAAMSAARVGDDVFDDDPSLHELQARVADILGKEAALFMPSGTMSNQIGLRLHCQPGDEFICDSGCHIYNYEQGAYAQLSGLAIRTLPGEYGVLHPAQLTGLVRPENDHCVRTRLLSLENTHNRGGGKVWPLVALTDCVAWARQNGLATHLDGARLFNAVVASGISARDWASHFDTVSICFSKGLGCPVGSALAGPRDLIKQARRHRKLFGGAMRQAGVLAAAATYALEHHIDRLAQDHEHARQLAEIVATLPGCRLHPPRVETNIVIFEIDPVLATGAEISRLCGEQGLLVLSLGPQMIRAVTHLDVTAEDTAAAGRILQNVWRQLAARPI